MFSEDAQADFIRSLLQSDIETCREIASNYSLAEVRKFVNKNLGHQYAPTCIHIAAHKFVSLEVWKFIFPLAEDKVLYSPYSPISFLLPDRDEIFEDSAFKSVPSGLSIHKLIDLFEKRRVKYASIHERHVIKCTQLDKVKFWLELTKNLQTKEVCELRSDILCGLCRCREGTEKGVASMKEMITLAKSVITNYNVDINGRRQRRPICFAAECHSMYFFDLFLSSGANPNMHERHELTLLQSLELYRDWTDRLEACSLLMKYGVDIFEHVQERGKTGLHSILIILQGNELKRFFKINSKYVSLQSKKIVSMPLPPLHGLIVYVKNHRAKSVQKSIVEKIKVLHSFGLDLLLGDIHNRTILHYACWLRMNQLVEFLVSKKISLFNKDAFGRDCLYYAITCPSDDTLKVRDPKENASTVQYLENILNRRMSVDEEIKITKMIKSNFDLTKEHLSLVRKLKGVTFVETLLKDPYIGPVQPTNLPIITDIWKLVNKLGQRLAQKNKALETKIELAGSMSENSKINPPDEFDFQFHLITLSPFLECHATDSFQSLGEVLFQRIDSEEGQFSQLLDESGSLNLNISRLFFSSAYTILQEMSFWNDLPFYWHFVHDFTNKPSLVDPLVLKWVNAEGSDLEISVDLVPIVVQSRIPVGAETKVPKPLIDFVEEMGLKWYVVCRDEEHGRFSFFIIERTILKRLNPAVQKAYKLTKSMMKFVNNSDITSYMLKNALFQELDPGGRYNLLKSQIALPFSQSYLHSMILGGMKLTLRTNLQNETKYIQDWAWRILDQLEESLRLEYGIPVYCSPRVSLPQVAIISDEEGDNPFLKTISYLKDMLKD